MVTDDDGQRLRWSVPPHVAERTAVSTVTSHCPLPRAPDEFMCRGLCTWRVLRVGVTSLGWSRQLHLLRRKRVRPDLPLSPLSTHRRSGYGYFLSDFILGECQKDQGIL